MGAWSRVNLNFIVSVLVYSSHFKKLNVRIKYFSSVLKWICQIQAFIFQPNFPSSHSSIYLALWKKEMITERRVWTILHIFFSNWIPQSPVCLWQYDQVHTHINQNNCNTNYTLQTSLSTHKIPERGKRILVFFLFAIDFFQGFWNLNLTQISFFWICRLEYFICPWIFELMCVNV